MGKALFTNNATSTLSGTLTQGGTTMVLSTGTGSKFPSPTGGDYFLLTIYEKDVSAVENRIEIVKVTARTGDTLTIERDVESTVGIAGGYAYPSVGGATVYCELRWTAGAAGAALQEGSIHAATGKTTPVDTDEIPIADSASSNALKKLTWANLKATAKTYFDTQYSPVTSGTAILKGNGTGGFSSAAAGTDYQSPIGTISGIAKGNGANALTAATAGTDYLAPPSGTALLKANSGGALANAVAGTDYQAVISSTGVLKGAGAGSVSAATAGTDFVAPGTATSFTKPQRPSISAETAPSTNVITWDLTSDQIFLINLNANITTFNLTGTLTSLIGNQYELVIRYNGGTTISFNANMKWTAGTAPTPTGTSGKIDILTFAVLSNDGGTTAYLYNTGIKQNL